MPEQPPTPETVEALMRRARALAGRTLADVAGELGVALPGEPRHAKGWIGRLAEIALGVPGGGRPEPDFAALGIELKTLPVDPSGRPRESTWVCIAPLDGSLATRWEASRVAERLARVLWLPVVTVKEQPIPERRFGSPLLWSPTPEEARELREDWEELTELVRQGRFDEIDARRGRWLQLRPKAANAREAQWAVGEDGTWVLARPCGFYLRSGFTARMITRHYAIPAGGVRA